MPLAESTSSRLAQPRVRIMPQPNISPPMIAPDRLPVAAIWRTWETSISPSQASPWVSAMAPVNTSSQTETRAPMPPCTNSMTAARRQKRHFCAPKPNTIPVTAPKSAAVPPSPNLSTSHSISAACNGCPPCRRA